MEECMLNQQGWQGRLKAEVGDQLYFDLSRDDEEVLGKQYDKIVERVVELLKGGYPEVSFDNNHQTTSTLSMAMKASDSHHQSNDSGEKGPPSAESVSSQWYERFG